MELETESYDDDDDLDWWCNDVWLSWLSLRDRPRLRPIYEKIGRSLDEILQIEIDLINSNTEVEPAVWIQIYAEKYRSIMDEDSSGTISQIKRKLYFND